MTIDNVVSSSGVKLLAELKELVDSFPDHQRKEVLKAVKTVISELPAHSCRCTAVNGIADEQSASETPTAASETRLPSTFTGDETK